MYEAPIPPTDGAAGDAGPGGDGPPQRRGRRGLLPGTKRGPYKRVPRDAQDRVVAVFKEGGDWRAAVAETANGISVRTVYGYITRAEDHQPRSRGGATKKVDAALVSRMVAWPPNNPCGSPSEGATRNWCHIGHLHSPPPS